jgi:hypothetical protein
MYPSDLTDQHPPGTPAVRSDHPPPGGSELVEHDVRPDREGDPPTGCEPPAADLDPLGGEVLADGVSVG